MCVYHSIHIHVNLCVCMCKILQKSGSFIVTARFQKDFSCSSSCCVSYMYCSLGARASPSLDHWEVLETSPAMIRGKNCPWNASGICVFSSSSATQQLIPIGLIKYVLIFTNFGLFMPLGHRDDKNSSASTEMYFSCKVVTAFPHH